MPLPENMGNLERYFRETPGVRSEAICKTLGLVGALFGLAIVILLLTVVSRYHPGSERVSPSANSHPGKIGIINPAWVEQVAFRSYTQQGTFGYYTVASSPNVATPTPAKYVYVSPEEAQSDLEQLVKIGYLSLQSGTPNIQRDLPTLKKLGYVVD